MQRSSLSKLEAYRHNHCISPMMAELILDGQLVIGGISILVQGSVLEICT